MLRAIDRYLNGIGMYRLVRDYLWLLLGFAMLAGGLGWLHYSPLAIAGSIAVLYLVGWLTNWLFARVYGAPTNADSITITVLILALIAPPLTGWSTVPFLLWAAVLAFATKYILAFRNKHIFNPAAAGVFLASLVTPNSAVWWVGTPIMLPLVVLGAFLIVRKVNRQRLFWTFVATVVVISFFISLTTGHDFLATGKNILFHSPIVFFASVMLTEPMTLPASSGLQFVYAIIIGFLFVPQVRIAGYYFTPETALLVGNVFAYATGPKRRYQLRLKKILRLSPTTYEYIFSGDRLHFRPGQYLELTVPHGEVDSRGIRRYFTIASAPTERDVRLGIKFYDPPSSYKASLARLRPGMTVVADQIGGDFVLPSDSREKLLLIAGGIGITPFRSMIKHLIDTNQRRDIVLVYSAKNAGELVYRDLIDAASAYGVRTVYIVTDPDPAWTGPTALTPALLRSILPDLAERTAYLSGPQGMVWSLKEALLQDGQFPVRIRTDYFPGFA